MRARTCISVIAILAATSIWLSACDNEERKEIDREWTSVKPEIDHPGEDIHLGEGLIEISSSVRRKAIIQSRIVGVDGFVLVLNDDMKFPKIETESHETYESFLRAISKEAGLEFAWIGDVIVISNMELKLKKNRDPEPSGPSNYPILPYFQFSGGTLSEMAELLEQEMMRVISQPHESRREKTNTDKALVSPSVWSYLFDMKEPDVDALVDELIRLNSRFAHIQQ